MDDATNSMMVEALNEAFPDLAYPERFSEHDVAYIVYESIFAAAIKDALRDEQPNKAFLGRAFAFLECLGPGESSFDDLIRVAVLESVHSVFDSEVALIDGARSYMGPRCLALSDLALQSVRPTWSPVR